MKEHQGDMYSVKPEFAINRVKKSTLELILYSPLIWSQQGDASSLNIVYTRGVESDVWLKITPRIWEMYQIIQIHFQKRFSDS